MMQFRMARSNEAHKIYDLYRSAVGSEFCVWSSLYPGMEEISHDLETDNLFVTVDSGQIVGAASIVPENEMEELQDWKVADGSEREIARIVVANNCRGRGIAAEMVNALVEVLRLRGCGAVHLAAAAGNIPAVKTYQKTGFEKVGETDMYGHHYYLFEKVIDPEKRT